MIPNSPTPDPRLTPHTPIRLIPGFAALMRLGRNYEDTTAVFDVYRYMNGSSFDQAVIKFSKSKIGVKLLDEPSYVSQALKDVDGLRRLPQDSLGFTYLSELEACGLDAAAVQIAADNAFDDPQQWTNIAHDYPHYYNLFRMLNWTHDLFHTLTGYGRDPLGEIAIHKFMSEQGTGNANSVMANLGGVALLRTYTPTTVRKVMRYAAKMGATSTNLTRTDLIPMLGVPLREARLKLKITPDPIYSAIIGLSH